MTWMKKKKEVKGDLRWSEEEQKLTKAPRTGKTINKLIAKKVEYPDDSSYSVTWARGPLAQS
jgi:hypothetical protein